MGERARQDLLVVGIGASSGGLEACRALFEATPDDTGLAYVIVMHLSPAHESRLAELLQPSTRMPVRPAEHGLLLEADHVYVIPPGASLALSDGAFVVDAPLQATRGHVVNHFFRSLAD